MIPNPWIVVGLLLAWGASLGVVGKWQNNAGRESERVAWQEREIQQVAAVNAKFKQLSDAARAAEQRSAAEIAAIGEDHAKAIEVLEARRRRDVVAARDGAIRLRVAGACVSSSGGSAAPEAGAAAGVGAGASTVELPREVTADLLALANDADQVADQLRACQAIAVNDRKGSP